MMSAGMWAQLLALKSAGMSAQLLALKSAGMWEIGRAHV